MKRIVLVVMFLMAFAGANAQEKPVYGWQKSGHAGIMFSQSAFKNWMNGGQDAMSGTLTVNYNVNYTDSLQSWTNKFILLYGGTQVGDNYKKADDQLEFNSVYGRKLGGDWSFSYYANFKTQLAAGYDYTTVPYTKISNFLAPAFFSTGPGVMYKPSDNFYVNIAPVTSKLVIVTDPDLNAIGAYGVTPGKSLRYELGMNYQMYFKTELMENVTLENTLNLFSNYLDKPQNIDIDNMLNLRMKVNKYLSAGLNLRTIYDDNTFPGWQISEVFGVELGFDF